MLTARAITRPMVTSETSDCRLMSDFAVGVSGIVSVGLKAVALVSETRPPLTWLDSIVCHLRVEEIGCAVVPGRAFAGAASVDLPVPKREDQHVGQPNQRACFDQLTTTRSTTREEFLAQQNQ